jgi:hypothetical protein
MPVIRESLSYRAGPAFTAVRLLLPEILLGLGSAALGYRLTFRRVTLAHVTARTTVGASERIGAKQEDAEAHERPPGGAAQQGAHGEPSSAPDTDTSSVITEKTSNHRGSRLTRSLPRASSC